MGLAIAGMHYTGMAAAGIHGGVHPSVVNAAALKRYLKPDDSVVWVHNSVTALRDAEGSPTSIVCVTVDISERKRWEEHQRLLVNELNHRVKNSLATVQSIASQTLRNAESTADARRTLEARLQAMARAHDVLTRENWESADLWEVVSEALAPLEALERIGCT